MCPRFRHGIGLTSQRKLSFPPMRPSCESTILDLKAASFALEARQRTAPMPRLFKPPRAPLPPPSSRPRRAFGPSGPALSAGLIDFSLMVGRETTFVPGRKYTLVRCAVARVGDSLTQTVPDPAAASANLSRRRVFLRAAPRAHSGSYFEGGMMDHSLTELTFTRLRLARDLILATHVQLKDQGMTG